jgi:hypothetical protein
VEGGMRSSSIFSLVFKNAVLKVASVSVILKNLNNTNRNSGMYSRYQEK